MLRALPASAGHGACGDVQHASTQPVVVVQRGLSDRCSFCCLCWHWTLKMYLFSTYLKVHMHTSLAHVTIMRELIARAWFP